MTAEAAPSPAEARAGRQVLWPAVGLGLLVGGLWLAVVYYFVHQARQAEHIRASASRIHNLELQVRRSEKNFMLRSLRDAGFHQRGESRYLTYHAERIVDLKKEIEALAALLPAGKRAEADDLRRLVETYDEKFRPLVRALRQQGYRDWGLEGRFRRAAHSLEEMLQKQNELRLLNRLLEIRRREKDYVAHRELAAAGEVRRNVQELRAGLRGQASLLEAVAEYEAAFNEYVELDDRIGRTHKEGLQKDIQAAIDAIEPATEKLDADATAAHARAVGVQTFGIFVASVLLAGLLGAALFQARRARQGEQELHTAVEILHDEMGKREKAQESLVAAHHELEARVQLRTAELAHVNRALEEELSERGRLEAQLVQAQKMDAVGRLAGGVAHDFNNVLMIILGHCELLLDRTGPDPAADKSARRIQEAAQRASALTRQLLAFSRKQVMQPRVLDLNGVVTEIEKMLRRLIGENIELVSNLAPDLGRVRADPHQLEQVIMNIAINARDAMPRGGTLRIHTGNATVDETLARKHVGLPPGQYVTLVISDSGAGMDAETLGRLFEPFFTTKEMGRGTGLGLATTYGIVKQSQGYIAVESSPGKGSTFRIYLPRVEEPAEARPAESPGELPTGTETVLLVEDEDHLRDVARDFLEKGGYRVLEAPQGAAALQAAQNHDGLIHLLITDVIMPGISGPELADQLKQHRPGIRVIFVSGYTDDALVSHGVTEADTAFLHKPFSREALLRKTRELLDRPEETAYGPPTPGA
jgi:signal transduction histidine kinase/ActR/RegA family two-component response regulator